MVNDLNIDSYVYILKKCCLSLFLRSRFDGALTALSLWHGVLNVFPKEQFLIVNGESFVKDPLESLVRVETFLGLDHWFSREMLFQDPERPGFFCLKAKRSGKRNGNIV